ncbi:MAG: serine hydrolase [Alphaproteobacteria bacterium]|nr:serine hydrolase [Alphaproteobacteria bacterium]
MKLARLLFFFSTAMSLAVSSVSASSKLDDFNSNPETIGYMQGFPPSSDMRIQQPDSNFFSFPKLRWSVCHLRELLPTREIPRKIGYTSYLNSNLKTGKINDLSFRPTGSATSISWKSSLAENYTDGILILHKGKIVYEYYNGCLKPDGKHAIMSMTKSFIGLVAEILAVEGKLDVTQTVQQVIPDLARSGFANATIAQVMDMTTYINFSEDYSNPNAEIWEYAKAASPWPKQESYDGPIGYYEYIQTVTGNSQHGKAFAYKTVNTDVLGWILSKTTGLSVDELISERIWKKIGADQSAYITVDGIGTAFSGGGMSASLRDLAKVGQLLLNEGRFEGQQIFPSKVVQNIKNGGSKSAFEEAGFKSIKGGSYKSMWWLFHNENGAFAARGVHGQTIYIDPKAEMVIVRLASHPNAKNSAIDPTSLPAYQAVADFLMTD